MLKRLRKNEYEVTPLLLTEEESAVLEERMAQSDPQAALRVAAAVKRAGERVSERPLRELLRSK